MDGPLGCSVFAMHWYPGPERQAQPADRHNSEQKGSHSWVLFVEVLSTAKQQQHAAVPGDQQEHETTAACTDSRLEQCTSPGRTAAVVADAASAAARCGADVAVMAAGSKTAGPALLELHSPAHCHSCAPEVQGWGQAGTDCSYWLVGWR